jgi:hypothetical protein
MRPLSQAIERYADKTPVPPVFFSRLLEAARRRGLTADAVEWDETPDGHNNTRFAAYQAIIEASGQRPAFLGNLWFMLPGSYSGELSSVPDMRVDFDAIKAPASPGAVAVQNDIPLSRE